MEKQQENAGRLVEMLRAHPRVTRVYYPGLAGMGPQQVALWRRQCTGSGSVISFVIRGGEAEAFLVLDAVRHMRVAVSLGGIETLIEHPWSMTHADMTPDETRHAGFTDAMLRLSVGLEDPADLAAPRSASRMDHRCEKKKGAMFVCTKRASSCTTSY